MTIANIRKRMTVFNQGVVDHLAQPLFFGEAPNVARYETATHSLFDDLTTKSLSFFWRPEEIDLTKDAHEFESMPEHWKFIFTENLKYQTLLDSVQGRAPNLAFLPICSDIGLENWITTWAFSETIHSRSYTHIMRNLYSNPSEVFDEILINPRIMDRATAVTKHYDQLIDQSRVWFAMQNDVNISADVCKLQLTKVKEALYLTMHAVNALEAIRFYVSFACTFNFAEQGMMEGNAKIMKLIARDEQLHLKGTQGILSIWHKGKDDPEMVEIAKRMKPEANAVFLEVAAQEKEWTAHLMSQGSMPGANLTVLNSYVDYLTHTRMNGAGLDSPFEQTKHPMPWIRKWLNSAGVQVAAQEAELSSYLVGQVNANVRPEFLKTLEV